MQQPQPYFKPLQYSANVLNERNKAGNGQPYFAPIKSQVHVLPTAEIEVQEDRKGDRLTSLHSRLHQEAEKIRKWKTQTEIDLKQKDRKIQESNQTVESLRKSILDMQLQNESLSLRLQEEMDNREEIENKITKSREMCNALKGCSDTTEQKLRNCETERTELKYLSKDQMKQFQELAVQFQELEISASREYNSLKNKLHEESECKIKIETSLREQLKEMMDKIRSLEKEKSDRENKVNQLSKMLSEGEKEVVCLQEQLGTAEEQFKQCQIERSKEAKNIISLNSDLNVLKEEHTTMKESLKETSAKLKETVTNRDKMSSNFDETEKLYVQRIKSIQDELQDTHVRLHKTSKELSECKESLVVTENFIEELKCSKDMLMLERAKDEKKIEELEESVASVKEKLNCVSENLKEARDEERHRNAFMEQLNLDMENLRVLLKDTEIGLERERQSVSSSRVDKEKLESSLREKEEKQTFLEEQLNNQRERAEEAEKQIEELQSSFKSESEEHQAIMQKISGMKVENKNLSKEIINLRKEVQKAKKDTEKAEKKESQTHDKLTEVNEEVFTLKNQLDEMDSKYKGQLEEVELKLQEEKNNFVILKQELETKVKMATDFEGKTKNLKSDMSSKNRQIKELEKEIRTLKGQVTQQKKTSANIEDDCKELQSDLTSTKETLAKFERETETLNAEVEKIRDEMQKAKKEAAESKKSCERAIKEKDSKVKETEIRVKDLMSVLDKYKKEKEEILLLKSEEVIKIKTDLEKKTNSAQEKYVKELQEAQSEVASLKAELEEQLAEKDIQNTKITEQTDKILETEGLLRDKDKTLESKVLEVTSLKKTLEEFDKMKKEMKILQASFGKSGVSGLQIGRVPPATPTRKQAKTLRKTRPPKYNESPEGTADVSNVMRTPQRSILKPSMGITSAKRRKVSFLSKNSDDDSDRSSNSSGEMMEIDIDAATMTPRMKSSGTPIYLKPSPKAAKSNQSFLTQKPKPRRPAIHKKKQGPPEIKYQPKSAYNERKTQKNVGKVSPFVKQTPKRTSGKFFNKSPPDSKKPKEASVAWLDSADPYGFADED